VRVTRTIPDLRAALAPLRSGSLGLVPTMGAFHDGHLSLLAAARTRCDAVAVSIFVNPLQFEAADDLATYPRDLTRDLGLAEDAGADVAFAPSVEEMYPQGHATRVVPGRVARVFEGAARPGHFEGVCTVVAKLFNLVAPTVAFFGQKDAQQVTVIRSMVADLSFDVAVEVCPTVRERDGLARSSRNVLLDAAERARAPALYRALRAGRSVLDAGGSPEAAARAMSDVVEDEAGIQPDYAAAVSPEDFGAPRPGAPVLLIVAARIGRVRLIDNILWDRA
jgi:pantoate--beta-alanine ligase